MITIRSEREIAFMREAGHIVALVFEEVKKMLKPGVTTKDIDEVARKVIVNAGAKPTFKGYGGFKGNVCVSVNDTLIHGIPSKKEVIKEGDIVSVDVGATYKGYVADACRTFMVEPVSENARRLVETTEESFWYAVNNFARPGNYLGDISNAIETYCTKRGYTLTENFTGHGVGQKLHEAPFIPNVGEKGTGPLLRPGMCLAIEPMVNEGAVDLIVLSDGWTTKTRDGKLASHYENSIVITENGFEVLTKLKGEEN
ncbi:MAG: type I methionyl aminopeptidase [Bacilli bacterium]